MSQIIKIAGKFSPLSCEQLTYLKALHERYPYKKIILSKPSDPYYRKVDLEIIKYKKYCRLAEKELINCDYDLSSLDEDIHLGTLYRFPKIVAKSLYRDILPLLPLVEEILKPSRYQHCLSTAITAKELAHQFHYNEHKAYLAGLLHDCLKSYNEEEFDNILFHFDKRRIKEALPTKHSFAASYFLKHQALLSDSAILNAIYHHTLGTSNAKLAKIVYIADKREPLRKINDDILAIAKQNLNKGFMLLKENVAQYLREKNGK